MAHIINKGRYGRETYPDRQRTGGEHGFTDPADTIARASARRLVDVNTTGLPDGTLIFVRSVRDFFVLWRGTPFTADDILVADAITGGGQWLRRQLPSMRWLLQAAWFIDPAAADDEGAGTALDPLKTHAELGRRALNQGKTLEQSTTVTLVSSLPDTDPIDIDVALPEGTILAPNILRYLGTPTTIRSGTFDAVTPLVSGTALPSVTDAIGGSFAGEIGARVRMTGGANSGARAWLLRDDGAATATTSAFFEQATVGNAIPTPTDPTTDTYVVETLPTARLGRVKLTIGPFNGALYVLQFEDLTIGDDQNAFPPRCTNLDASLFVGCDISAQVFDKAAAVFMGSLFRLGTTFLNSFIAARAAAVFDEGYGAVDSFFELSFETTAVGVPLVSASVSSSRYRIEDASAHDSSSAGLTLMPDVSAVVSALLWGDGNTTYGINARGGQLHYDPGTQPTITGVIDDTRVGGIDKAYAALPFLNAANGAAIVDTPT
jgi:hypothetical protein